MPWIGVESKSRLVDVEVLAPRRVRFHFDGKYPYQLADAIEGGIIPEVLGERRVRHIAGAEELAAKPLTILSCCPTSPIKWSDVTSQNVVDCARYSIPVEFISMPLSGFMAPVTLVASQEVRLERLAPRAVLRDRALFLPAPARSPATSLLEFLRTMWPPRTQE